MLGLKTIVFGLKTIINASVNANIPQHTSIRLNQEEIEIFSNIYHDGLMCFKIFDIDCLQIENGQEQKPSTSNSRPPAVAKEEKEILEHFVTIFTLVDPAVFHEVFQMNTQFFFDRLCADPAMLAVPQYLLASEVVSRNFSSILLSYLMRNLFYLGNSEQSKSTLILRYVYYCILRTY